MEELIVSRRGANAQGRGFYTAVFVVGTATMILAHKLDPQKPARSAGAVFFEKRVSGSALPELKFIKLPPEAQDI